jgi:hypothetical protein
MATSKNIIRGTRSRIISRTEPQNDWDSFSLTTGAPEDPKGFFSFPTEVKVSHRVEPGVEGPENKGRTVTALSSKQQIPQRRGIPRKK